MQFAFEETAGSIIYRISHFDPTERP